MKKTAITFALFIILILSGCSVQERVSPLILIDRLTEQSSEIIFDPQYSYFEGNSFIGFINYKNINNVVIKIHTADGNSVKKISVYSSADNKVFELIKLLIDIYSPKEDCENILKELTDNTESFRYSFGKEYSYSLAVTDDSIYFEAFNNNLSEFTIPDLTLKANDRINY